jgi:DNA excision repair protein ERCC-3
MTKEFYDQYLRNPQIRKQQLLYIMNPRKFRTCEYLVKYHEQRGDKIIIFSDDVVALRIYATALGRPFIYGETPELERNQILNNFKSSAIVNCIGLSKVGDTALDLPEANVIIQVSSHFGARRQEAQRLGRILRPKQNQADGEFNAFFYTLVSTDTREMFFSAKRQQYLVDQGYTFKVVQDLAPLADASSTLLKEKKQEIDLLGRLLKLDTRLDDEAESKVMKQNVHEDWDGTSSHIERSMTSNASIGGRALLAGRDGKILTLGAPHPSKAEAASSSSKLAGAKRKASSLSKVSGVDGSSYSVFNSKAYK